MLVSASVKSCFLTSTSDLTELSAAPSSGSVCSWYMVDNIFHFEIQNIKMYLVYLSNLSRSGNTWWSKGGVTSIFWAPNIAFLLLLFLLMVTFPCLLLSPGNKTLYFCAKMSTRKIPASVQGLVLDEEGEFLKSKILLALSTCQGISANHCWIWGRDN